MQPHIFIGTNPEACRLDKGSPITLSNTGTYIGGGRKQDISDTYFPLELLESTYPHMKINLSNTNPYILRIEDVSPNTNTFGIFRLLEPLIPTKINYNTQPFFISSDIMMILFNRNLHMKHMGNYPAELSIYSLDFQIDQKNPPWPLNVLQEYNMGHKFSFTIGKHKFTDNIVREELTVSDNHAQLDWNYMQASWNISDRGKELTGSLNGYIQNIYIYIYIVLGLS